MTPSEINKLTDDQALRIFKRNATAKKAKKGEVVYTFNRGESFPFYRLSIRKSNNLREGERVDTFFSSYGKTWAMNKEKAAQYCRKMFMDNYRFFNFKTDFQ